MPELPQIVVRVGGGVRLAAAALLLAAAAVANAACDGKVCPVEEGLRALGARSAGLIVSSAHAAEKPSTEPAASSRSPLQGKRSVVYMTAVSEDGQVYSYDHGPIVFPREARYGLLALFVAGVVLLYTVLTSSDRSRLTALSPRPVPATPPADASPADLTVAAMPMAPGPAADRPPAPVTQDANWATLVRLCGGDPVRAATVIAGETAADPSASPDSPETLARAIARVRK